MTDFGQMAVISIRLAVAMILGGLLGYERERQSKAAGLRTYMLVAIGSALFTIVPFLVDPVNSEMGQIVKGIAAGVGFLGAGAIMKRGEKDVEGITTAAGIWMTAAAGLSVGAGHIWPAVIGVILALAVFSLSRLMTDEE